MKRAFPAVLLSLCVCGPESAAPTATPTDGTTPTATGQPEAAEGEADASARLAEVVAGTQRSADNKARDGDRHPIQTLQFFGVRPEHTVIELWPGGGWYTEILAPYVKGSGKLVVTLYDENGPEAYYGTGQAKQMLARFAAEADVFGEVEHVLAPQKVEIGPDGKVADIQMLPLTLGPAGSADVVLTFRNSHGWYNRGAQEMVYKAAFDVLAPGGVFGVVQHRAAEGADPAETAKQGYLPEATVIEAAQAVGFQLAETSEINANPRDTRDYPEGVWTLPPALRGPEADRAKYLAIGESDRMTLKFVKPAG